MKNIKILKDYYHTLTTKGKAMFVLGGLVVVYIVIETIS